MNEYEILVEVKKIREYTRILTEDTVSAEDEDRILMSIDKSAERIEELLK